MVGNSMYSTSQERKQRKIYNPLSSNRIYVFHVNETQQLRQISTNPVPRRLSVQPLLRANKEVENAKESSVTSNAISIVPGLSKVTDSKRPLFCRGFWAVILILATLTCAYQVGNRVGRYLQKETVFLSKVAINNTVTIPSVTVCLDGFYGSPSLKKEYSKAEGVGNGSDVQWLDLVGYKGMDVMDVWNTTSTRDYIVKREFVQATLINSTKTVWKSTILPTIIGMCETMDFSENIVKYESGSITYLKIIFEKHDVCNCGFNEIKIRVHSSTDSMRHAISRQGLSVFAGMHVDLLLSYRQVKFMSTSSNPCVDETTHNSCLDGCLDDLITKGLSCRLPFMEGNLPFCKDKKSAQIAFEKAEFIYNSNPDCPHCLKKCTEDKYSISISPYATGLQDIEVGIYYKENLFQIASEVYAYDIISCLSDIGGNLGLFLGFCIIHILELLDDLFIPLSNKFIRKYFTRRN